VVASVRWLLHLTVWWKFTDISEVLAASIIRASTSETSVKLHQTIWRNYPEDSHVTHIKVFHSHEVPCQTHSEGMFIYQK
jgi:hypothetical protein